MIIKRELSFSSPLLLLLLPALFSVPGPALAEDGLALLQRIAQDRQVLLDDRVERGVFRLVPSIARAGLAGLMSG